MTRERNCPVCGNKLYGRVDKKFCSDSCRNAHNNQQNRQQFKLVRKVNNKLHKNRRILAALNPEGKVTLRRQRLEDQGFDFNYFTSLYQTKDGHVYHYCYEHGYLPLEKGYILLVRRQEW